jgi:ketol-acid reductoisomerase
MAKNSKSRAKSRAFAEARADERFVAFMAARKVQALQSRQERSWAGLMACISVVTEAKEVRRQLRRKAVDSYNSTISCGADHGDYVSVSVIHNHRRASANIYSALQGGEFRVQM